jgi:hypothetical protein
MLDLSRVLGVLEQVTQDDGIAMQVDGIAAHERRSADRCALSPI